MNKKFIAYEGELFTIEWYYHERGKSLANTGKIRSEEKFRNEGNQIFSFKPSPDKFFNL